ncbi:MAG: JAB domain-containing protein [Gammaproteobacteria bacterium]|nr:JAB domain-containing protein [Gammaproteobacteria bacterium]
MTIKDWPRLERPRERLLASGPAVLSDAELLATLLGSGTRGRNAVDLARHLLSATGGLHALLELPAKQFTALPGLGPARYVTLQAALELSRRYLRARLERSDPISAPHSASAYLSAQFRHLPREVFGCLFLDTRHQVIAFETLFLGTLDAATVHPREVVRRALELNAGAVILAHNHPSGVAEPSQADRALTRRLTEALGLIDVRIIDHVVIGDGETTSFAERGWL